MSSFGITVARCTAITQDMTQDSWYSSSTIPCPSCTMHNAQWLAQCHIGLVLLVLAQAKIQWGTTWINTAQAKCSSIWRRIPNWIRQTKYHTLDSSLAMDDAMMPDGKAWTSTQIRIGVDYRVIACSEWWLRQSKQISRVHPFKPSNQCLAFSCFVQIGVCCLVVTQMW